LPISREKHLKENLYVSNSAMMLTKYSPWTDDFNSVIALIRAGGLIKYYWDKPLPLQLTLDHKLFTTVDNSNDKLTTDTFFLLFLIWAFGMVLSLVALAVEIMIFKRSMKSKVNVITKKTRVAK
jgi:hypothetical protein